MNNNLDNNFNTNSTNNVNNTNNTNVVNNPGTINNNVNTVPDTSQTTNIPATGSIYSTDSSVNVSGNSVVPNSPVYDQNSTEVLGVVDNNSGTSNTLNNNSADNYVYTPPSKYRYFLLIMFFFVLLAIIIFLPDLTQIINLRFFNKNNQPEVITDGTLECTLKKTGSSLDVVFSAKFNFAEEKLNKLTFTTTTNGDSKQDNDVFNENYNKCQLLKNSINNVNGIAIRCELNSSSVSTIQVIDYNTADITKVTSAFAEAGGVFTGFQSGEDINKVEREMSADGYTCNKYK